jgi:diadenosine tetraphosphate (Ap4A) HIT family hydrolase
MANDAFQLDPQLERDTHELGSLGLSRALLMNDRRFPWLILVPQRPGLVELIDLDPPERSMLLAEISRACEALRAEFAPHKLNVAALGNVVRQLHVHVIARFTSDAAWAKPVWGVGATEPYEAEEITLTRDRLCRALHF